MWQPGTKTSCGQILQPLQASEKGNSYLNDRDTWVIFYSFLPKFVCVASWELYAIVKYFFFSDYDFFKVTFKLHSGTASPNSSPDSILKRYLLDSPSLTFKSQTHSVRYSFWQKRERNMVHVYEEEAFGWTAAKWFLPVKYSIPKQAEFSPPGFPQIGTRVQMVINVTRSPKGYFRNEQRELAYCIH